MHGSGTSKLCAAIRVNEAIGAQVHIAVTLTYHAPSWYPAFIAVTALLTPGV